MADQNQLRRAKLKKAALLRARFNAEVALARIDYKLDVIDSALEELDELASQGVIKEITGLKDA